MATTPAPDGHTAATAITLDSSDSGGRTRRYGSSSSSSGGGGGSSPGSLILDRRVSPVAAPDSDESDAPRQARRALPTTAAPLHRASTSHDGDQSSSSSSHPRRRYLRGKPPGGDDDDASSSSPSPLLSKRSHPPSSSVRSDKGEGDKGEGDKGEGLVASARGKRRLVDGPNYPRLLKTSPSPAGSSLAQRIPLATDHPKRIHIPADIIGYGTPLRSKPGPAPSFLLDLSALSSGPSDALVRLVTRATIFEEQEKDSYTADEISSHIVRSALPNLFIASPDISEDEASELGGSSYEGDDEASALADDEGPADDDDDRQDSLSNYSEVLDEDSDQDPLGWDGHTEGEQKVYVYFSTEGRPMFNVNIARPKRAFDFGFGQRPSQVPHPLPVLANPPKAVILDWRNTVTQEQRAELRAEAKHEFKLWRGLLGTAAAVSSMDELEQLRKYQNSIRTQWEYSVKRATVFPHKGNRGSRGLIVDDRNVSQQVWGLPQQKVRRYWISSRAKLPGLGIKASFKQYASLYNLLASLPPWVAAFGDVRLLYVTQILAQQFCWLSAQGQAADTTSVLSTIDQRIGGGAITLFHLFMFDIMNKRAAKGTRRKLRKEARAKGCPLFGLISGCPRGSHIDAEASRFPQVLQIGDGINKAGLPAHRLNLVPCAEMAGPHSTWDTRLISLDLSIRAPMRARKIAKSFFDSGEAGVVGEDDLLHGKLPVHGIRMSPLADLGKKWLATVSQHVLHHPPPPPLASEGNLSHELALGIELLRGYDDLVSPKLPPLFDFSRLINPRVALVWRVNGAVKASMPSPDRIVSITGKGERAPHSKANLHLVSRWLNMAKHTDCLRRVELGVVFVVLKLYVDVKKMSDSEAQSYRQSHQALVQMYKDSTDKTSAARLTQPTASKSFSDLVFSATASQPSQGGVGSDGAEDKDSSAEKASKVALPGAKTSDGPSEETSDGPSEETSSGSSEEMSGGSSEESSDTGDGSTLGYVSDDSSVGGANEDGRNDADAKASKANTDAEGGTRDQILKALDRRKSGQASGIQRALDGSPSLACLKEFVQSLPPEYSAKLESAEKMEALDLPTLGWFLPSTTESQLLLMLAEWIAYCENCEAMSPWKAPVGCALKNDTFVADEASEHLIQSLKVGLTPANLYAALLILWLQGDLDECHLAGLSLRDALIAITIIAHRIHGLPFASGFNVAAPTSYKQYRDSSRLFLVESKIANWIRHSYEGPVFLNNIFNALPWVVQNLSLWFSGPVAAAISKQLQELMDDSTKMVTRANAAVDPFAFANSFNLTQQAIVWKRLYGDGVGEEYEQTLDMAAAEGVAVGTTKLHGVLPMTGEMTWEKRRERDARIAGAAVAATPHPPAAVLRSRYVTGESAREEKERRQGAQMLDGGSSEEEL